MSSLLLSFWTDLCNIISGFFAIIPQTLYFLYASAASILDMLQYLVRKLAGLDVYYVNGEEQTGDILVEFIEGAVGINSNYSTLSTVLWSMVIFGVILLVFSTIITMIKTHYDYDSKKSSPMYIISQAIKGLITMVIIPIVTIFSLYMSEVLLRTLDAITSGSSTISFTDKFESSAMDKIKSTTKDGYVLYGGLDFFGGHYWTNSVSFSGTIFASATYNANRVRMGEYDAVLGENNDDWSNLGVFWTDNSAETREVLATQIDTAFEYSLSLKESENISLKGSSASLATSYAGLSNIYLPGLVNITNFSKFDVGLVWYYYNLWSFDYFIGFAGIITALTLMFNIILGLITRLIYCLALFLVYPPLCGLFPFDNGNAVKSWRTSFTKMFLSAFSTVVAINVLCIILPFLRTISLFNVGLLDNIMVSLFTLAGLMFVKKAIAMMSSMIGAENLEEIGGKMVKDFQGTVAKALNGVMKMVGVGISAGKSLKKTTKKRINNHKRRKWNKQAKILNNMSDEDFDAWMKEQSKNKDDKKKAKQDAKLEKKAEKKKNKKSIQERANQILKGSKKLVKKARKALEKEKPEWFVEGKNGLVIDKDKVPMGQYLKALAKKKQELAMEQAKAEFKEEMQGKGTKGQRIKNFMTNLFYKPQELDEEGNAKPRQLKNGASQVIDLAAATIKLNGDLLGVSGFSKVLSEAGVVDSFKENAKKFGEMFGMTNLAGLETASEKKKREEKAEEEYYDSMKSQSTFFVSDKTIADIEKLSESFKTFLKSESKKTKKKKPKNSGGGSGGNGGGSSGGDSGSSNGITSGGGSGGDNGGGSGGSGGSSGGNNSSGSGKDEKSGKGAEAGSSSKGAKASANGKKEEKLTPEEIKAGKKKRAAHRRLVKEQEEAEKKAVKKQQDLAREQMIEMAEARKKKEEAEKKVIESDAREIIERTKTYSYSSSEIAKQIYELEEKRKNDPSLDIQAQLDELEVLKRKKKEEEDIVEQAIHTSSMIDVSDLDFARRRLSELETTQEDMPNIDISSQIEKLRERIKEETIAQADLISSREVSDLNYAESQLRLLEQMQEDSKGVDISSQIEKLRKEIEKRK